MVDRMDIDALLIGSLYGELTPADQARLQAHLESHPADRTVLSNLTHARRVVRESRIFELQLEPPQAVSALLLQEAARRAPRVASPVEVPSESWFQRFLRSFAAHPGLAAAAMLVVVLGFASMLYVRDRADVAQPDTVNSRSADPQLSQAKGEGQAVATPATSDDYRVGLAGDETADPHAGQPAATPALPQVAKADAPKPEPKPPTSTTSATPKPADASPAKKRPQGIEVEGTTPAPKELDDAKDTKAKLSKEAQDRLEESRIDGRATGGAGGNAAGPSGGVTANRGFGSGASAPGNATPTDNRKSDVNKDTPRRQAPPPAQAPAAPQPAPPPPPVATVRDGEKTGSKTADKAEKPAENLAFARAQHDKIIAAVKADRCKDASALALDLESRAPSYYAQNVAGDRSIKACFSYIAAERAKRVEAEKKASRARASERTNADEPARAEPTTNK